jgi:hypothetical protein
MWAILARPGASYSPADIQQMGAFLGRVRDAAHATWDADPGQPPPTMQVVRVGLNSPDYYGKSWNVPWCTIVMQVTNTGGSTVQIPQVGLRLTAAPAPNADQYPLAEVCSVLASSEYCGPQYGGGPAPCSSVILAVTLSDGPAGAMFPGTPAPDPAAATGCPEVTLAPGSSVTFVLKASSSLARDFPAEPYLRVSTAAGTTDYGVPAIAGHLKFADASQFSCQRLTGGSFTVDSTGAAALDFDARAHDGKWCA